MSFYADLKGVAQSLITEFGGDVTFTIKGNETYNPATGSMTSTNVNETKKALVLPYLAEEESLLKDDVVYSKALKLTIAGEVLANLTDTVTIGSETFTIKYKNTLTPDIVTSVYTTMVAVK